MVFDNVSHANISFDVSSLSTFDTGFNYQGIFSIIVFRFDY